MANLLTLNIMAGYTRPVVLLEKDVTCLFDTGADIPVWTQGSVALGKAFNTEKIEDKKFLLSGFGKEPEIVEAYRVSDLVLKGEDGMGVFFL